MRNYKLTDKDIKVLCIVNRHEEGELDCLVTTFITVRAKNGVFEEVVDEFSLATGFRDFGFGTSEITLTDDASNLLRSRCKSVDFRGFINVEKGKFKVPVVVMTEFISKSLTFELLNTTQVITAESYVELGSVDKMANIDIKSMFLEHAAQSLDFIWDIFAAGMFAEIDDRFTKESIERKLPKLEEAVRSIHAFSKNRELSNTTDDEEEVETGYLN